MGTRFLRLFFGAYSTLVLVFVGTTALLLGFFVEGQWFRWGCWIALELAFLYASYIVWRQQLIGLLADDGAKVLRFFEEVRIDCGAETRFQHNPKSEIGRPLDYGIDEARKPFYAEKQLIRLRHELHRYVEKSNEEVGAIPGLTLAIDWRATTVELRRALGAHVRNMESSRKSLWIWVR